MKTTVLLAIVISLVTAFASAQCVREDLQVYGIVKGQVVEDRPNGEPVRGVSISVSEDKYEGKLIVNTTTDERDNFTLPRVKPGRYSIAFRYPNHDLIVTRLRVLKSKSNESFVKARIAPPDISGTDSCEGDADAVSIDSQFVNAVTPLLTKEGWQSLRVTGGSLELRPFKPSIIIRIVHIMFFAQVGIPMGGDHV